MLNKQQNYRLSIETTTNQGDFSENLIQDKRVTGDQNENTLKFLYAFEKPALYNKNIASCRNNAARLSAFDFMNVSSNKANEKKKFSIALNYFKNEERKTITKWKQENLYGFSKVSSKIK
ncbi:unnamed protein product [Paramecium octaurelia]|uniref:Uncharacterized protein n=1 Tax=Paramecium octaurelia TaxID=43137 RepID=A0A8S1TSI5_PAROT|nr:unnamed protein product [Paramecium octaurelia]